MPLAPREVEHGELFTSHGRLRYTRPEGRWKLIVECDQQLADYYESLMPPWIERQRPRYRAHISVVRNVVPPVKEPWGRYEGERIEFAYSNYVHEGTVYFWLNAFSVRLEEVRQELGLNVHDQYTLPPGGFRKCFHLTLANRKAVQ